MELRLGLACRVKEISRIQRAVAEIFDQRTMQFIRPAFGYDIDYRARIPPVLSLEIRDHAQLRHRINGQNGRWCAEYSGFVDRRIIAVAVVHVGTVEQEVIRAATRSIHRKHAKRSRRVGDLVGRSRNSGRQVNQLLVVASIDGQILHRRGRKGASQGVGSGLHLGQRLAGNLHGFRYLARLKLHIHSPLRRHVYRYACGDGSLEAALGDRDRVSPQRQFRDAVAAIRAGLRGAFQAGGHILSGHLRAGNHRARRVRHRPQNRAAEGLREQGRACQDYEGQHHPHFHVGSPLCMRKKIFARTTNFYWISEFGAL